MGHHSVVDHVLKVAFLLVLSYSVEYDGNVVHGGIPRILKPMRSESALVQVADGVGAFNEDGGWICMSALAAMIGQLAY